MCKQLKSSKLRDELNAAAKGRLRNADFLFSYLLVSGIIAIDKSGQISVADDYKDAIKNSVKQIGVGDITWSGDNGLFLVVDAQPKVLNDGHHFMCVQVTAGLDGYQILTQQEQPTIIEDIDRIHIRHSDFNVKKIIELEEACDLHMRKVIHFKSLLRSMKEGD